MMHLKSFHVILCLLVFITALSKGDRRAAVDCFEFGRNHFIDDQLHDRDQESERNSLIRTKTNNQNRFRMSTPPSEQDIKRIRADDTPSLSDFMTER